MKMAKKFYWLKMDKDYLSSPRIKKLRKIAGGDTYTIIYLKMQLLSIESGGIIKYEGIEPTLEEELALVLNEDVDNVKVTISFLLSQGLLTGNDDDTYLLSDAAQRIGSESESRERVRAYRERKKALSEGVTCNAGVTGCNTDIEIDTELDREIDTDSTTATRSQKRQRIPYDEVVNLYSSICVSYPKLNSLSDKRKKAIAARFRNGRTLDDFEQVFRKAEASSFLKGANKNNWSADFDWMLNDSNMTKILEDKYIDKPTDYGAQASQEHRSGFPDYGHGSEEIDISKNPTYGENWRERF